MEKLVNRKFIFSLLITVLGFIVLISGTSYAILRGSTESVNEQIIRAGSVELVLTENFQGLNQGISVMEDPDGLLQETAYEFNIRNTGSVTAKYDLKLEDSGTNAISDSYVKVGLEVNGKEMGPMKLSSVENVIDSNTISKNEVIRYKLRLWIDHTQNNSFNGDSTANLKLKVDAKQAEYKETIAYRFDSNFKIKRTPITPGSYTGYCVVGNITGQNVENSCNDYSIGIKTEAECLKTINEWGGTSAGFSCVSGSFTVSGNTTSDYTSLNKNYFLKHTLENNAVLDSYLCYVLNNEAYCIKGGGIYNTSTSSWVSQSIEDNTKILKDSFGENNCQIDKIQGLVTCTGEGLTVRAMGNGYVSAKENNAQYSCAIYGNNASTCGVPANN